MVATMEQAPTVQENTKVATITGYIFGLHNASRADQQQQAWDMQGTMQPSNMEDLILVMAALREYGPVTSLPPTASQGVYQQDPGVGSLFQSSSRYTGLPMPTSKSPTQDVPGPSPRPLWQQ